MFPVSPPGLVGVKQRALAQAVPLSAYLELTYACTWRCVFCYNPRRHDLSRLSAQEWCGVLDDLRALGCLTVTLTGGEPLAHPEFLTIARAVRDRALALRVLTNGSLLDRAMAEELAALDPLAVELSLHGASAATHDRAAGRPGAFNALMTALDHLQAVAVPLVLKSPLTRINEGELEAMLALAAARGLLLRVDPTLKPRDDGDPGPLAYQASRGAVAGLYARLAKLGQLPGKTRSEGGVNCGLGRLTLAIDPEGNVYPCIQWRHSSLGNVRTTRLAVLWRTSLVREEAAEVASEANRVLLAAGEAVARFPFCPAAAVLRHGDPFVVDATVRLHAEVAHELRSGA